MTIESTSRVPLWARSASDLAAAMARGDVTAREIVDACLARVAVVNPRVNAVTQIFEETARAAADAVDARRRSGKPLGPLAGVPFTVKENIDVEGTATTHGVAALRGAVVPLDAPIVERLRAAGAIPIGHTNLPDLSLRLHTRSQLYGDTVNPWNAAMTPGGSSGGEGVAIATGMSALGLGNDAGGSVRVPAQLNGVVGLKPTVGRLPSDRSVGPRDVTLASQLIPVEGILARTVADVRLALRAMAGPHPRDPRAVPAPLEGPPLERPIRVAVVSDPGGLGVDPAIAAAIEDAAAALRDAGYEVEPAEVPSLSETVDAYGHLVMTEFASTWPMLKRILAPDAQRYIELAMELRAPVPLPEYLRLTSVRQGLQRQWAEQLARTPLVLAPALTELALPVAFDTRGLEEHRRVADALRLCAATSFVGVPAIAVPAGVKDGLPRGVQLIAGFYREDVCLDAAEAIESRLGRLTPIDPRA